ncbi:hypothetical protein QL285_041872 [Trifolium repens]|nr:hypothetical protein QL285_041872 [Trifolium repens]
MILQDQPKAPDDTVYQPDMENFGLITATDSSDGFPLVISHDVYDTNNGGGDDSKDLIILDEEVSKSKKGKAIEVIHQILDKGDDTDDLMIIGEEVARDVIDIDDDDDLMIIGEDVSKSNKWKKIEVIPEVVAHLDNIDVASKTEAPFTLFRGNSKTQGSTMGSSSLQNKVDNTYDSTGTQFTSPLFYQATPNKRKSTAPTPPTSANFKTAKKEHLHNVDKAIPNKMKSTAPTPPISANFKSAKKEHLDNVDISYKRPTKASTVYNSSSMNQVHVNIPSRTKASFTSFGNFGIGLRQSTFESNTWYDTYDYDHDDYDYDYDDYDEYDDYDDTYDSTSTYQYTSNMRKSTALTPITSNFRSVKKEEH